MNLVIISDLHLHEWSYGGDCGSRGTNVRLLDQEYALMQVLSYCEQWEVDTILMGGDLFHTNNRVSGTALAFASAFYQQAAKNGIKIYSIVGNHDQCGGGFHSLSWIDKPHTVVEHYLQEEIQGRKFTMVAHEMNTDYSLLPGDLEAAEAGDVYLIHQGVAGADVGNGYVLDDAWVKMGDIPDGVQIIAGHYHKPQVVGNVLIPGALNQHNWGDCGQKRGFWHWKGDEFLFIESRVARFHKFDMGSSSGFDEDRLVEMLKDTVLDSRCSGYFKVLNYLGDQHELRAKIREHSDGLCRGVEFGVVTVKDNGVKEPSPGVYLDQEVFVKDWIKSRITHYQEMGTQLYEGTYETP